MTTRQTVLEFVRCFCAGEFEALGNLITEDCRFSGPFLQTESRAAYLSALMADPHEPAEFSVLALFDEGDAVGIFYSYSRGGRTAILAQLCRFRAGRIADILLVFDPTAFG